MEIAEIAQDLVNLCRRGQFAEAVEKHYSENIISLEPAGENSETVGLDGVKAKGEWWTANHEVHDLKVEGPFLAEHKFVVRFTCDVTFKPEGRRFVMDELGIYTVQDGKISHEQFFYDTSKPECATATGECATECAAPAAAETAAPAAESAAPVAVAVAAAPAPEAPAAEAPSKEAPAHAATAGV